MNRVSNTTFVLALVFYFVAAAGYFGFVAWRTRKWKVFATAVLSLGWVLHLVSLIARTVAAGHAPWGNMYEFTVSLAFVVVTAYLFVGQAKFDLTSLGGYVAATAAILMSVGWVLYADPGQLQPALRSNWLTFHVFLVMAGASLLLFGAILEVMYLLRHRWEARHPDLEDNEEQVGGLIARLPSAERLDQASFRMIMFAFPIWTLGVIAGAIWGEQAWGRYWGWDPKETMSFIVLMIFAAYLHARATQGWRGRGAAILAIVGGVAILVNFYAVNLWIAGLHSYAGT